MAPTVRFEVPGFAVEAVGEWLPADPAEHAAEVARLLDPAAAVETLHWGRNYIYRACLSRPPWPEAAPEQVAVKQFRNQGARARLRRRLSGTKAAKSWRIARALAAAGVPTPEPVLVADSIAPDGPSFFVTRHLAGVFEARYLFRALQAGESAERFPGVDLDRFFVALGRTVARLHAAGFWHRDLSSGNVLVDWRDDAEPNLYLVDLNRTRRRRRLGLLARTRDLCRLAIFREEHQELFLAAYWGGPPGALRRGLYRFLQGGFLAKNRAKAALRAATRGLVQWARDLVLPRRAHAHIPAAPAGAAARDQVVWDRLSDQPHHHAGKLAKLGVRLADLGPHAVEAATALAAAPRIRRRYRELAAGLGRGPVPWQGAGVALRPWPDDPEAPLAAVADLGVGCVLLRLHPWAKDHDDEEALARELAARGLELTFALPQNRDLVRDPARWRAAVEELAERFAPHGHRFVIGQAINRSKWGAWTVGEYLRLAEIAGEILRRRPGVELAGPGVIDFEPHAAAAVVNARGAGVRFDALASLLYVDRRGAPENRQLGFDTVGKLALLKAIADTARHCGPRSWVTEVNWPLREGPHSPAGRLVSVDEETQADYLARYYLLALPSGLVERVFWWQLIARGYGLIAPEPDGLRRRPAFHALATLQRLLAGTTCEGALPAPAPARLLAFRRPDGTRLVAGWSTGAPVEVELPGDLVRAWNRDGEDLTPRAGGRARLGGAPLYFSLG